MEVELLDRLNADALILRVRWKQSAMGKNEAATVCVHLSADEIPAEAFESKAEVSIELPDRIRASAIAQAEQVAHCLSGLYRELPDS
jgi:hypothetical protein